MLKSLLRKLITLRVVFAVLLTFPDEDESKTSKKDKGISFHYLLGPDEKKEQIKQKKRKKGDRTRDKSGKDEVGTGAKNKKKRDPSNRKTREKIPSEEAQDSSSRPEKHRRIPKKTKTISMVKKKSNDPTARWGWHK